MLLSIIIPTIGKSESSKILLANLVNQINEVDEKIEIIIVSKNLDNIKYKFLHTKFISSNKNGRACNLNFGADCAKGRFLWFVHDDSQILENSLEILIRKINEDNNCLYYFDLKFLNDGSKLNFINSSGANLRSKLLKIPFGDQAFCISNKNFFNIGKYNELCKFGEDHLLTWQAKRNKIKIKSVNHPIFTSAIKYKQKGWLNLTINYQFMWISQALKERFFKK